MKQKLFHVRTFLRWTVIALLCVVLIKLVVLWWGACNSYQDPLYLITVEESMFKAGDHNVLLPKGLVLYPVNEQEVRDKCYPGGQYKIYVCLGADASGLNAIGWPLGMTNVVNRLQR